MKTKKKIPLLALAALLVGLAGLSAAPSNLSFCHCSPRCPSGYFCEQDGMGGCSCSPI